MTDDSPTLQVVQGFKDKSPTLKAVKGLKDNFQSSSQDQPDNSREKKLFNMISGFQDFCNEYIDRVYELAAKSPVENLETQLEQVLSVYWNPIANAAEQHQPSYKNRASLNQGYDQLDYFQKLLNRRLSFELHDHIVLYFEGDVGKATRFPFGSTRLISVPLSDAKKGDWMAIPHELGHHLYWNAQFSENDKTILPPPGTNFLATEISAAVDAYAAKNITTRDADQSEKAKTYIRGMLDHWTEEIFADVVGTRIAGTNFVNAASDRVLKMVPTSKKDDLFLSDGAHPIPYLLPYLRAYAMDSDMSVPVPWDRYKYTGETKGGVDNFDALIIAKDDPQIPISISGLRLNAMKTFVKQIVVKLQSVEIEELIEGSSPVTELVRFILSINPDANTDAKMLTMLLTPVILEKNEYWICANGDKVKSKNKVCPICGARRWPWSPRVKG